MYVEKKIKREKSMQEAGWWEPDEAWCALWKLTHLSSSGMKKQAGRNGVYQTNDGNGRKSCAGLVRGRASIDDADTGEGSVAAGRQKWEAGEDGEGSEQSRGRRCTQDDTRQRTKDTLTPCFVHTLLTGRESSESYNNKHKQVDSSTLATFWHWDL